MALPASMRGLPTKPVGGADALPGGYIVDPYETTTELVWPKDLQVYDYMRRTDSQTRALLKAATLPILGTPWSVVGKKCRPEVVAFVKAELGLMEDEDGRRRARDGGVVWDDFLRHALLMLPLGFMPFEFWYDIGRWELDDSQTLLAEGGLAPSLGAPAAAPVAPGGSTAPPGRDAQGRPVLNRPGPPPAAATAEDHNRMNFKDPTNGGPIAHLNMAPRMPRTIARPEIGPGGELRGLWQSVYATGNGTGGTWTTGAAGVGMLGAEKLLDRERLVLFTNEREGSNYFGQSILRVAYKHWMIKDALIRVGAMSVDRQGMGVPVVTYPDNAGEGAKQRALEIATQVRVGEESGVALEEGWTLSLLGVHGAVADALEWVKYHDQAQSRSMLAMFLDLGHDNGARALGDTFVDYFLLSERAILRYIEEVITEEVVRPLVRTNFGPDEVYPSVVAQDVVAEQSATAKALAELASVGIIRPDDAARSVVRKRMGLPPENHGVQIDGHAAPDDEPTIEGDPLMQRSMAMALRGLVGAGIPLAEALKMLGIDTPPDGYDPAAPLLDPATGQPLTPTQAPAGGTVTPPTVNRTPGSRTRLQGPQMVVPRAPTPGQTSPVKLADMPEAYVQETEQIRDRRGTADAQAPHSFRPAKWTHPNGHPRCLLCGCEERTDGTCVGAAGDGLTTSAQGSKGVATALSQDEMLDRAQALIERIAALR